MAYVIKVSYAKSAALPWFVNSSASAPTTNANIDTWNKASTGFLLRGSDNDAGTGGYDFIIVFDTQVNGDAWLAAKASQADWVVHDNYYTTNGGTITSTKYP